MGSNEPQRNTYDRRSTDATLARVEESLDWIKKGFDELKESDRQIHVKIDKQNAEIKALVGEQNQAKGAAKAVDWVTKNWMAILAAIAAGLAYLKGGPPAA